MCEMTNRDIGLGMWNSSPTWYPSGYKNPFECPCPNISRESSFEQIMKIVNQATKELEEEMYKFTGYEINTTDEGVEIVVVLPGVKKEDISVKFQKNQYVVKYTDRDSEEIEITVPFDEVIECAEADVQYPETHNISLALGILTIKVPYEVEQTQELDISEEV